MAQFLVVEVALEAQDNGPDEEPGDAVPVTVAVHVCSDSRSVHAALKSTQAHGNDWTVWEVKDGKTYQRCVVFQMDGRVSYDVAIQ